MARLFKNSITGKDISQPKPTKNEVFFKGGVMVTETDLKGIITYTNKKYREFTGYSKEELIGLPHAISRHPDMPKKVYENMWSSLKSGKEWEGLFKNLTADGSFYYIEVMIQHKKDSSGKTIGYSAVRKIAKKLLIEEMLPKYKDFKDKE